MTPERPGPGIDEGLRRRLAVVADGLIPEGDGMPAPSSVDIGGRQLDLVLESRPDLADDLRRALDASDGVDDAVGWLESLRTEAPPSYDALVTAVVAGYYMHPEVKRRLGYPGQVAQQVSIDRLPDYMEEGLLERVYERGPIYRPTPPATAGG
jgi:hypothetical protein